jgi:N-acetylglutamate synthase-like GNAT family acetyltransferase
MARSTRSNAADFAVGDRDLAGLPKDSRAGLVQSATLRPMNPGPRSSNPFSERDFYLAEFRGRTLAIALSEEPQIEGEDRLVVEQVLVDLAANETGVVLLGEDAALLSELSGAPAVEARGPGWVGAVWRQLRKHSSVGLLGSPDETLPALCSRVALELQLSKLIWLGSCGMLWMPGGRRRSLVDLAGLEQQRREAEDKSVGKDGAAVAELLREIEIMISGGVSSVSACLPGALSDELFTYAGSGTFYSPEGYTEVRRLALDEFAAAENLIQHGVEEGYLLSRSEREIEVTLTNGFGAFIEGRYLAGICALLPYPEDGAGELSSIYALTRFLGEGVGAHLLRHAVECAQAEGLRYVFACTTSQRVEAFFLRSGFRSASQDELPASKWERYDPDRLQDVRCLRRDLD